MVLNNRVKKPFLRSTERLCWCLKMIVALTCAAGDDEEPRLPIIGGGVATERSRITTRTSNSRNSIIGSMIFNSIIIILLGDHGILIRGVFTKIELFCATQSTISTCNVKLYSANASDIFETITKHTETMTRSVEVPKFYCHLEKYLLLSICSFQNSTKHLSPNNFSSRV